MTTITATGTGLIVPNTVIVPRSVIMSMTILTMSTLSTTIHIRRTFPSRGDSLFGKKCHSLSNSWYTGNFCRM